jgi:hypothetical protein
VGEARLREDVARARHMFHLRLLIQRTLNL